MIKLLLLIGTFNKRKTCVFHIYMKVTIITSQRSSWTLCSQCSLSFGLLGNNPCTVDLKNVKQDTNCNELHKDYFLHVYSEFSKFQICF